MTPYRAYEKARALGKRIPELELVISKDAYWSYRYARDVIKGKWKLGEPVISQDAFRSYCYATDVIKGRFILGESAISKNDEYSYWYSTDVIKGRLPDFMHNRMILENDEYTKKYIEYIE